MHPLERAATRLRHSRDLGKAGWLWDLLRPAYDLLVRTAGSRGLRRNLNGTDPILVAPGLRGTPEVYEPEVWAKVMEWVRPGDVICDVGAHFGLYSVAFAKRVGPTGRVHAFEPEPGNCRILMEQVALNGAQANTIVHPVAVGKENAKVPFSSHAEQSGIASDATASSSVSCVTLDTVFATGRVDVLKVDVEGFEEWVLAGAARLLADPARRPRAVFVEVHPYAWHQAGSSSDSLLGRLRSAGYVVRSMTGTPVSRVDSYGHIHATLASPG